MLGPARSGAQTDTCARGQPDLRPGARVAPMSTLEIVPRRRLRSVLVGLLVVALVVSSGYLVFLYESLGPSTSPAAPGLLASRHALREQVETLRDERDELRRRVALLERGQQVERKAYSEVERHLLELQSEIADLREQVAFYEAIVSSPATKRLSIQTLSLDQAGPGNAWRFQVVLTRNTKSDNVLSGSVELAVQGEQRGETRRLSLSELTVDRVGALAFQFRYFQRLEGRLILPPEFVPRRVVVHATEKGSSGPPVERAFDWPAPVS